MSDQKILTVDDDKGTRLTVSMAFRGYACRVIEAEDGVEGLAVADRERPDLILLDHDMPVMDGFEMLSRLKAHLELRKIPVLMLTANSRRETVAQILKLGVKDYVMKPFTPERILERVKRFMELTPRGDWVAECKRSDGPLQILAVDDKPGIIDLIQKGLAGTAWQVRGVNQPFEALEACKQAVPDIMLISLSLPGRSGFTLFRMLRTGTETKTLPVLALSVKTATDEQIEAQQLGFTGIVTKPIEMPVLRQKIVRALGLDTSHQYFQQRDNALLLTLPAGFNQLVTDEVTAHLREKVRGAVDAGLSCLVVDLSQLKVADAVLIKLGLEAIQASATEFGLGCAFIGSEVISKECANFQETRAWKIANSFEEAVKAS